jgi:hypothetical protein
MALAGARREDRDTAAALVSRAEGAVDEVKAYLDETKVVSPAAGEVYRRNVEPGEIVPAGFPIVTLVDVSDVWVTFQVLEDRLERLRMGATFSARFPALGGEEVGLKVSFVAPQGDFATWRATSAQGGFDLKTFEVRARPARPVPHLRPGMSAVVTWPRLSAHPASSAPRGGRRSGSCRAAMHSSSSSSCRSPASPSWRRSSGTAFPRTSPSPSSTPTARSSRAGSSGWPTRRSRCA